MVRFGFGNLTIVNDGGGWNQYEKGWSYMYRDMTQSSVPVCEGYMQTKPKANSVITHQLLETGILRFNVLGAGFVDFDRTKVHAANLERAALHGFIQRISDAAALSRNTTTGAPASPADKLAAMEELVEHYHSGAAEWKRTGTGTQGGLIVRAIMRVKGLTFEAATQQVEAFAAKKHKGDTAAALRFLATGAQVMAAMDAIRQESRPAPKVDADEALGELAA